MASDNLDAKIAAALAGRVPGSYPLTVEAGDNPVVAADPKVETKPLPGADSIKAKLDKQDHLAKP